MAFLDKTQSWSNRLDSMDTLYVVCPIAGSLLGKSFVVTPDD
jgi:hypothetical protein